LMVQGKRNYPLPLQPHPQNQKQNQPKTYIGFGTANGGTSVGEFRADILVESLVIVELKALQALESAHERQLTNYLKATDIEVGLLFNFGPRAQFRRLIFDNERKLARAAAGVSCP
jgi:hypothetical protein